MKGRERLRGEGTELSWLMRTTYIANELQERKQKKEIAAKEEEEDDFHDRDSQIISIEVHSALAMLH